MKKTIKPILSQMKKFIKIRCFLDVLIVLCFFIGCKSERIKKTYENDIEAIEYIEPNSWVPKYKLTLDKKLEISKYKDSIYFGALCDFLIDQKNNILIVERASFQVHKFSKNGMYIKSFGREGRGPCECVNPGPLFFYDSSYYLLSQEPPKLINFDTGLNCINDIALQNTLFWVFRNQNNEPSYFLTHQLIRGKYIGYSRTFHRFTSLEFKLEPVAVVNQYGNDETKDNIRFINYDVKKRYVIADDGELWLNGTTEYKIDIIKDEKKIRSILIEMPLERYTEEELQTYKTEIEANAGRSIISRGGLQTRIGTLPEHHTVIHRIINFHNQIWVLLRKSVNDKFYRIHVYNLNGNLDRIITVLNSDLEKGRLFYRKDNFLYVMGVNDFNYVVKKYKMNFVKN